jgi:hypothetical protein
MLLSEEIQKILDQLPPSLQVELLNYAEFLATKSEREAQQERRGWSNLSLSSAMRGMEDEESPADPEAVYWQRLADLGLIKTIRSQFEPVDFTPVPVNGAPVSHTIIEERR